MPQYVYKCTSCGERLEQTRPVEARNQELGHLCEERGTLKRVYTSPGISIEGRAFLEYRGDPNEWFAG